MTTSAQTEAVLLLTLRLGKVQKGVTKPLTAPELHRLAEWLAARKSSLADLLGGPDTAAALRGFDEPAISPERVAGLLSRAGAVGLQLERWRRAHLWVITRYDHDYPSRLLARLHAGAPPVLYGCGHRPLLDRGGLAIVGSRDACEADLAYTKGLARTAARDGITIVSGGARGVDETAMLAAIDAEGTAVGILADGLLRAATSVRYRAGLMKRNLALVTPYNPEAGFDVGNAMGRNRLIYCAADAAVVVASARRTGGTWAGAAEALKHQWAPVWVRGADAQDSGNASLVEIGGRWMPSELREVGSLLPRAKQAPVGVAERARAYGAPAPTTSDIESNMTLYEVFLAKVEALAGSEPVGADHLRAKLDLTQSQIKAWLNRAVGEKKLQKLSKPLRYRVVRHEQQQLAL